MSQSKEQQAIKELQEKLMSDIIEEFSLLTVWQQAELLRQLGKKFYFVCGDPESKNHWCEK